MKPLASKDEAFHSRLVFDLDGNGISGRWYRLLASKSAPLKQTLLGAGKAARSGAACSLNLKLVRTRCHGWRSWRSILVASGKSTKVHLGPQTGTGSRPKFGANKATESIACKRRPTNGRVLPSSGPLVVWQPPAPGDFAPPFGICCSESLDFFPTASRHMSSSSLGQGAMDFIRPDELSGCTSCWSCPCILLVLMRDWTDRMQKQASLLANFELGAVACVVNKAGNYMASVQDISIGARPFHGLHLLQKESSWSWVLSQRLSVAVAHPPARLRLVLTARLSAHSPTVLAIAPRSYHGVKLSTIVSNHSAHLPQLGFSAG